MNIPLIFSSLLLCIVILLSFGLMLVYDVHLWTAVQTVTTEHPLAHQTSFFVYSYLTEHHLTERHFFLSQKNADGDIPTIDGFTPQENSHIADVKFLVQLLEFVLFSAFLLWLTIMLDISQWMPSLFYGASLVMIVLLISLIIPFDTVFYYFHVLFFPQGNWTFSDGIMIEVFPELFFSWMAHLFWIRAFSFSCIAAVVAYFFVYTKISRSEVFQF